MPGQREGNWWFHQLHADAREFILSRDKRPLTWMPSRPLSGSPMKNSPIPAPIVLAEILRLQRWAGGDSVSAARTFGLMHGIESVIRLETESYGISEETQRKIEDILADIENDKQSTDGMSLKARFRDDGIRETDVSTVMELCRLQSRFGEAINKIIQDAGSLFSHLANSNLPEQGWFGALHYMELVDCTEGARKKLHAVFAPTVPRVGEIVMPENGSPMLVTTVEHRVVTLGRQEGQSQHCLVPYVCLEAISDDEE